MVKNWGSMGFQCQFEPVPRLGWRDEPLDFTPEIVFQKVEAKIVKGRLIFNNFESPK
jgi:hypothetical protein